MASQLLVAMCACTHTADDAAAAPEAAAPEAAAMAAASNNTAVGAAANADNRGNRGAVVGSRSAGSRSAGPGTSGPAALSPAAAPAALAAVAGPDAGVAGAPPPAADGPPLAELGPVSTELTAPPPALASQFRFERIARGLKRPVGLEVAPGDTDGRLFVVEQHVGRIRIMRRNGDGYKVDRKPFLRLKRPVSRGNEQGLLGLAFHPRFGENRRLYINFTDKRGTTHIVEYRVAAADPNRVDLRTARQIFRLDQPYSNHNGGYLTFGPDGKLYVGTGDGGAAGDPLRAGQDPKSYLAKMLRFDVDAAEPKPEIVQMGLRNPWRYHFDAKTGDLYIADVGQNRYEYIYAVASNNIAGHNFGWNVVEGNRCYARKRCDTEGFTPAVIEYDHSQGCSVTGGIVYRGSALPELDGMYFYADFCTGIIRSFRWAPDGVRQHWSWDPILNRRRRINQISAFGADADGELYALSLSGGIYKLVRRTNSRKSK